MEPPSSPEPFAHFQCSSGTKMIRDYILSYSIMDISISSDLQIVFPRTGFLIFSFITGADYECRFLNYNLSDSRPYHLYICGLLSQGSLFINQKGSGGGCAMKVHPVIGYYFLNTPMYQLTDKQIQLSDIIDREALFLRTLEADHQINSFDDSYLAECLQKILPKKSRYQNDPIYHAVNTIMKSKGRIGIKKLAAQYHMSERNLHRQFLLKVGLSPQAYAKIWQLQHVMELLQRTPDASLSYIAFEAGYYDVAHLAHDFKHKVSVRPSKFHQAVNPLTEGYLNYPNSIR